MKIALSGRFFASAAVAIPGTLRGMRSQQALPPGLVGDKPVSNLAAMLRCGRKLPNAGCGAKLPLSKSLKSWGNRVFWKKRDKAEKSACGFCRVTLEPPSPAALRRTTGR
ncbi:hypothetical protein, partial [Puniceibacterium confluentis]|uniref:hypothetical protein n=1 Tax=Puniceibacterium confluentis TaxID=1958944 RepID=UPI001C937CBD